MCHYDHSCSPGLVGRSYVDNQALFLNVDVSVRPGGWRDWRERYGGCFGIGIYFVSLPMPMDAMELYIA